MGASPQQKALEAAQSSVAEAVKQGKTLAKDLQQRGKKYRNWAGDVQEDIIGYLGEGQDPASYYSRITSNFGDMPSMPQQIATYQSQLNKGDYPVLGSPSHQRFEDTLVKSANLYDQYIKRGLDEIQPRFAAIAKDPAFNLQYDPRAMQMAQGNINEDQVRRLTSYNV
jgi:hypothetical protein